MTVKKLLLILCGFAVAGWATVTWLDLGAVQPLVLWLTLCLTITVLWIIMVMVVPHPECGPQGIERFCLWAAPIVTLAATILGGLGRWGLTPQWLLPGLTPWPVILSTLPMGILMLLMVLLEEEEEERG